MAFNPNQWRNQNQWTDGNQDGNQGGFQNTQQQIPQIPQTTQPGEQNKAPSILGELISSVAGKMIFVILIVFCAAVGVVLTYAFMTWMGLQVQDFVHFLNRLFRIMSHRPGSANWWGGFVQLVILLGIIGMIIIFLKRNFRR